MTITRIVSGGQTRAKGSSEWIKEAWGDDGEELEEGAGWGAGRWARRD